MKGSIVQHGLKRISVPEPFVPPERHRREDQPRKEAEDLPAMRDTKVVYLEQHKKSVAKELEDVSLKGLAWLHRWAAEEKVTHRDIDEAILAVDDVAILDPLTTLRPNGRLRLGRLTREQAVRSARALDLKAGRRSHLSMRGYLVKCIENALLDEVTKRRTHH